MSAVEVAEQAAESVRAVNRLTFRAPSPGTPGWEDVGDFYWVLSELRVLVERLPQACTQLARHLDRPAVDQAYEVDAMTNEPAEVVVASAALALDDAGRCSSQAGETPPRRALGGRSPPPPEVAGSGVA